MLKKAGNVCLFGHVEISNYEEKPPKGQKRLGPGFCKKGFAHKPQEAQARIFRLSVISASQSLRDS